MFLVYRADGIKNFQIFPALIVRVGPGPGIKGFLFIKEGYLSKYASAQINPVALVFGGGQDKFA